MEFAVDHPHGGGRGKSKGNRNPVSPWGRLVCCLPPFAQIPVIADPCFRPKVEKRHGEQRMSTDGWLFPEYATTENAETRRASKHRHRRVACISLYIHMYKLGPSMSGCRPMYKELYNTTIIQDKSDMPCLCTIIAPWLFCWCAVPCNRAQNLSSLMGAEDMKLPLGAGTYANSPWHLCFAS